MHRIFHICKSADIQVKRRPGVPFALVCNCRAAFLRSYGGFWELEMRNDSINPESMENPGSPLDVEGYSGAVGNWKF
jgi:hypothetical protein